ncbi:MAG: ATP-dependent helicase HrpB [Fibrobacterota bacterium]|jgi:ATP-dependent helicase HrpB
MTGSLPIEALRERILTASRKPGAVIVQSPTGSGKSTQIPQMLLEALPKGEIWVLEPRRLAVRSLAGWVAKQRGGAPGDEVGYRVRFESKVGPATRLIFLTPGTALRMLASNPTLQGVAAVCLDEFHERGADCDAFAALALALACGPRPDLGIWILSATIDTAELEGWIRRAGVPACSLVSDGRTFPIEITHQAPSAGEATGQQVARALRQILSNPAGDVLVFLPGQDEIRRATTACQDMFSRSGLTTGVELCSLHGELDPAQQDEVLRPAAHGKVKVILSTNVAETSLTIPGVRHVIDSGWVRRARFDPLREINTLWTVRASHRSCQQRAGRAGRVAAGTCVCLWDRNDVPPLEDPPEVERIELSGLWLQILGLGIRPESLRWPTAPRPDAVEAAHQLLVRLGALDSAGRLNRIGQDLSTLPVSPRCARVLLEALEIGGMESALDWAAQHESQGPDDARRLHQRLRDALGKGRSQGRPPLGRLLLPAHSDRIAQGIGNGRWRLSDGRTAMLDNLQEGAPLLLALEVQETASRDRGAQLRLRKSHPIEEGWILDVFPEHARIENLVDWDPRARRVVGREVFSLFGQELSSRPISDDRLDRNQAEALLASKVESGEIRWAFGEEEIEWTRRVRLAAKAFPEMGITTLEGEDLDLVRAGLCEGCLAAAGVEGRAVLPLLREAVGGSHCGFIDNHFPVRLNLPNGKRARIEYRDDGLPLVQARISDLIGVRSAQVQIAKGRLSLLWEILAPNQRPVQRTADLDGFWTGSYPEIRKDLARRYPRHPWP